MRKVVIYTDEVANSDYDYLEDFGDIFLPDYKNSKESVFAVQCSDYKDDNTSFGRANWSNMLNGCWGMWSCGWDFHKPSQNLVNAFSKLKMACLCLMIIIMKSAIRLGRSK